MQMIQKEKFSNMYKIFIKTYEGEGKTPSSSSFSKFIKQILKDNGMTNPNMRAGYTSKKSSIELAITLPEEKEYVNNFKESSKIAFTWKDQFEDLEDDFDELMSTPDSMPFGQLVYGNGGTGKSFHFNKEQSNYDMEILKGSPNTARLIKYLYDYRNIDCIVFDDADSVVTNANSAVILKMALDDTVSERVIHLPKGSGKDLSGIETDVFDNNGNPVEAFKFNSQVVIITNLKDIKDKALKTRLYTNPIFMTKEDIVEKIADTCNPSDFGCTKQQADDVALFLTALIESGEFEIKNESMSYRFFKVGLKMIKRYPERWKPKVLRKMEIGVRMNLKDQEKRENR